MLKIGLIGCGMIAQVRHAPEYNENAQCELVAYYDFDRARAEKLAQQFGGTVYDSVDALLASDVDAVSVCVSNSFHAPVSIQALAAGKHVLCEKPMAISLAECEAMVDAAKKSGKLLMLAHNQRFNRTHVKAREMIAAGDLGRVIGFDTTFGHSGPEQWTGSADSWFVHKDVAVFGVMADLGVHKVDLLHYLLDEPICEVAAFIETLDKTYPDGSLIDVDDNTYCVCRTRSGALGTVHVSWTFYGKENNSTKIYGTKGILRLYDDAEHSLIFEKRDGTVEKLALDAMTSNEEQTSGKRQSTGVIDAFVGALASKASPIIDGAEALRAMRVIFAAAESAMANTSVKIQQD